MASKAKAGVFPICIICGRPGIPLGSIGGKDVAICADCVRPLYDKLEALIDALKVKPKVAAKKPAISLEGFREKLVKDVEEKGSVQAYSYGRRYGISRRDVRRIVQELASEKGWKVEQPDSERLYLRKAEAEVQAS